MFKEEQNRTNVCFRIIICLVLKAETPMSRWYNGPGQKCWPRAWPVVVETYW